MPAGFSRSSGMSSRTPPSSRRRAEPSDVVTANDSDGRVQVTIRDTGIGMSPETLERWSRCLSRAAKRPSSSSVGWAGHGHQQAPWKPRRARSPLTATGRTGARRSPSRWRTDSCPGETGRRPVGIFAGRAPLAAHSAGRGPPRHRPGDEPHPPAVRPRRRFGRLVAAALEAFGKAVRAPAQRHPGPPDGTGFDLIRQIRREVRYRPLP